MEYYITKSRIKKTKCAYDCYCYMSMHPISVTLNNVNYRFEVGEYAHQDELRCKFNVHYHGKLVATFAPDRHRILHLCKNHGNLKEPLLNLIADQIEQLHVYGFFEQ